MTTIFNACNPYSQVSSTIKDFKSLESQHKIGIVFIGIILATFAVATKSLPVICVAVGIGIPLALCILVKCFKKDTTCEFWESITPANIDDLLDVNASGWCQNIKANYFSLTKHKFESGIVSYSCSFQYLKKGGWMSTSVEVENGGFKMHQNGTRNTFHYFKNFDQFLQYLLKEDFYQGEHFKADFYIFHKKDGSEIVYPNPFR